jgi:hypothetical protein
VPQRFGGPGQQRRRHRSGHPVGTHLNNLAICVQCGQHLSGDPCGVARVDNYHFSTGQRWVLDAMRRAAERGL